MYSTAICHVVAMPYPGRGHINPLMNLCKLLVSRKQDIIITFVVTEEWLGLIGSNPRPDNIRFRTIPNVIPSERVRAQEFSGFYEAVMIKMEAPFEQLLDRLEPPVTAIIADLELRWPINLGTRRNIPVAALWTASTLYFSLLYHFYQFSKEHLAVLNLPDHVDYIPGISSSNIADLKTVFHKNDNGVLQLLLDCISRVPKAQYLLFTSIYELEPQVTNSIISAFPFPVYHIEKGEERVDYIPGVSSTRLMDFPLHISGLEPYAIDALRARILLLIYPSGPSIPWFKFGDNSSLSTQMDEIAAGSSSGGVRILGVVRGETGGFWTDCGWNSIREGVFEGMPFLSFPKEWTKLQIVSQSRKI
ncbi:hypothetical protein Pint_32461 [Pistacia integerrima]|uniref:Uncharacterized protein n=1 Tax=Pistacia integerrima TaxID=434235 RepID=A0ACC0XM89_9ROSI|nr:hypothetical protein Pint_32461 [Pistacia integerrima]